MLKVDEQSHQWFKDEMTVPDGWGIRFFGKGYGQTNKHEGISIGIEMAEMVHPIAIDDRYDYPYFVEDHDAWLFDHDSLYVSFDPENNEPIYYFK